MIFKIVLMIGLLFLWGCAEPLLTPTLLGNDIHMLRDGGYCRDQWGRELGDMACSQQHEKRVKDRYRSR